jgi:hypothetical protein
MTRRTRIRGEGVELPCNWCKRVLPHENFPDVKGRNGRPAVHSYCRDCKKIKDREAAIRRRDNQQKRTYPNKRIPSVRYDYAMARLFLNYTNDQAIAWLARGYKKLPETISSWVEGVECEKELEWLNTDVGDDALTDDGMQLLRAVG